MGIFSFLFPDRYDVEVAPAETEKAAVLEPEQPSLPTPVSYTHLTLPTIGG